jgi:hypothetical protein
MSRIVWSHSASKEVDVPGRRLEELTHTKVQAELFAESDRPVKSKDPIAPAGERCQRTRRQGRRVVPTLGRVSRPCLAGFGHLADSVINCRGERQKERSRRGDASPPKKRGHDVWLPRATRNIQNTSSLRPEPRQHGCNSCARPQVLHRPLRHGDDLRPNYQQGGLLDAPPR